jgi:Flp pilus assembly protein TadB
MESREKKIKSLISREYKIYREEERQASLPRTLYEKACNFSVRVMHVSPDKTSREKLQNAINFAHLNTTPDGILSLTIFFMLATIIPLIGLMLLSFMGLGGLPAGYGALAVMLALFFTYYLYLYPYHLRKRYEMSAGSDIVTFILYIVMYMKNTPSLEGAVRFAAENIKGDLGYELKKLLWDVEVGNFLSMEEALSEYTTKWVKNRPFVESTQMIISSMRQAGPKREEILEESVRIILDGNREQAKNFNQRLRLPVTVIHALGIILPVMGLVFFPIVAVFLGVDALMLFVGYDVVLPIILYFIITNTMEIRPATFSKINLNENPDIPPPGRFKHGKKNMRAWPIGLIIGAAMVALGAALYFIELAAVGEKNFEGIYSAIVLTGGIAVGFAVYYILLSSQRLKVREETRLIEGEFAEALFQLGNQVSGGTPLELSIQHSMDRIKNLKIKELFSKSLNNMKMLGMTFQQSFFDEKYGATRYYPSMLIKSVMRTIVESSKKGVRTAASVMMSISTYLKGLHDTQEDVKEALSDTLSSLKFQAYFLTPMISGVVGTLAIIIIQILRNLGEQSAGFGSEVPMLEQFSNISITPFAFVLIVSIYMIETSFILSLFINSIENGEDDIGKNNTTGYTLLIGFFVFAMCLLLTLMIFKPLIPAVAGA